jgi:hypothetical protein
MMQPQQMYRSLNLLLFLSVTSLIIIAIRLWLSDNGLVDSHFRFPSSQNDRDRAPHNEDMVSTGGSYESGRDIETNRPLLNKYL